MAKKKLVNTGCVLLMFFVAGVLWAQTSTASDSQDIHSLEDIERSVREFIMKNRESDEQDITVKTKSLDSRLRLTPCSTPLDTFWSPGSRELGRVTVQVACSSPRSWRIHVQANVTMQSFVWTLARGVQRGELLDSEMLLQKKVTLGAGNTTFASSGSPIVDIQPLMGFEFTQRVNSGQVLQSRMLKPANLVSKGEAVLITHRSTGLSLQTKGIALNNAAANQQLQVRNSTSGKIVDALAISRGTVEVLN